MNASEILKERYDKPWELVCVTPRGHLEVWLPHPDNQTWAVQFVSVFVNVSFDDDRHGFVPGFDSFLDPEECGREVLGEL